MQIFSEMICTHPVIPLIFKSYLIMQFTSTFLKANNQKKKTKTKKSNIGLNSTTEILWIHYRKASYLKLACACKYDDDDLVDVTGVAYVEGSNLLESEGELIGSMRSKASFKTSFSFFLQVEYWVREYLLMQIFAKSHTLLHGAIQRSSASSILS